MSIEITKANSFEIIEYDDIGEINPLFEKLKKTHLLTAIGVITREAPHEEIEFFTLRKNNPAKNNIQRVILPEGVIYPDYKNEYPENRMANKLKSRFNIDWETEFIMPSLLVLKSHERDAHKQLSQIDKKFKPRAHVPLVTVQELEFADSLEVKPTYKVRELVPEWVTFDDAFNYLDEEDEATKKLVNPETGEIPGMQRRDITRIVLEEAKVYIFGDETED